jgi:DNA-binding SARP family transcriptional activator
VSRVALTGAAMTGLVAWGSTAAAEPVGQQFAPTQSSIVWPAVTADGTAESSTVVVDVAEVAPGSELPDEAQLTSTQLYLYVALHPTHEFAGVLTPLQMPATTATLVTPEGTVSGLMPPANYGIDASWYFPVSANLTTATLDVASFSQTVADAEGDFTTWTFSPQPIGFVGKATASVSGPAPTRPAAGNVANKATTSKPMPTPKRPIAPTGGGIPLVGVLGGSLGGIAVLGAGSAGMVSFTRRRAFYRADREGRVVLTGPPVGGMVAAGALVGAAGLPEDRHDIVVKLLGWLEVEGTKGPITAGPLLEIIVFLVLNPGRSFTSVQLRESIWGLGRQPITSASFRTYMVTLRKALGPGVVVTDKYHYGMTGVVTSDWGQFQTAEQADDQLSGREQALDLVRGPVLHGCFDSKKNSPFAWAFDKASLIEVEITTVAAEVASARLDQGDARRAAKATAQGLLCSPSNMSLRTVDLKVGAAVGGPGEVGRRLEAARGAVGAFPQDVAELEEIASQLGWAAPVPS